MSAIQLIKPPSFSVSDRRARGALHGYQRRAAEFILSTPRCALWVEMGLGKTATTLTAVAELRAALDIGRVLVVSPKRVADTVWHTEAAAWEHTHGLRVRVCTGTEPQRLRALRAPADVYTINYENLVWLVERFGDAWPWDLVVLDESSKLKDPSTKRWKALRRILQRLCRVVELTGTPAPQSLAGLWSQIYLLDGGQRLGKTYGKFVAAYFDADPYRGTLTPKPGAEQEIHRRVSDIVFVLRAQDYLELPQRVDNVVRVALDDVTAARLRKFERELFLELATGEITAATGGVLAGKLQQAANGAVYDANRVVHHLHDHKLDALADVIEGADGPVLVAYQFQHDLARIRRRFPHAATLDGGMATVNAWNAGKVPLLLVHPASAGHGLNLQHGGHTLVWFALPWSVEQYQQTNARLHRQGQRRPVVIHHLLVDKSIDHDVLAALQDRAATQDRLLAALHKRAEVLSCA